MIPYYHSTSTPSSPIPPTPRYGTTFPPLKYTHTHTPTATHGTKIEGEGENDIEEVRDPRRKGPFDEDDIELQLSSSSPETKARCETALRVLKYCSILFLGLVVIGTTFHISNHFYHPGPHSQIYPHPPHHRHQHHHHHQIIDPALESEDRAPEDFVHEATTQPTPIHVPTYPECNKAECLVHQIPGNGAEPVGTATIYHDSEPSSTKEDHRVTATSPPICVPPHCYPQSPGETPPICIPPHCYPHPPPGHHHHHHDNQVQTDENQGNDAPTPPTISAEDYIPPLERVDYETINSKYDETPPICVPPHCYPHPSPTHQDQGNEHKLEHKDKHNYEPKPPPCLPPHCYPPPLDLNDHEQNQDQDQGRSPPICVPPHCYPHKVQVGIIIQSDLERENEYMHLESRPVILRDQVTDSEAEPQIEGEEAEVVKEGEDRDEPICMPPVCIPPPESPPICVPPSCVPPSSEDVD